MAVFKSRGGIHNPPISISVSNGCVHNTSKKAKINYKSIINDNLDGRIIKVPRTSWWQKLPFSSITKSKFGVSRKSKNEKELLSKYKEDCLIPLLQDYLALPEGKLTNSKIKLKGLHKLQSLTNEQSICNNSSDSSVFKVDEKEYSVCDIEINPNTNTTSATLTSETEVLENIEFNSSELSDKIRSKLYPDNGDGHDSYNEDIVVIVANNKIIRLLMAKAKSDPKKVVFVEADRLDVLKAAQIVYDEGIAIPTLIGRKKRILLFMVSR